MFHPISGADRRRTSSLRVEALEGREAAASIVLGGDWLSEDSSNTNVVLSSSQFSPSLSEPTPDLTIVTATGTELQTPAPSDANTDAGNMAIVAPETSDADNTEIRVGRGGGGGRYSGGQTNQPPVISNFVHVMGVGNLCTFTGQVTDETPGNLTIRFSGVPDSLQGKTTTTNSTGAFTYSITLLTNGNDTGMVYVQTTDPPGLDSNSPSRYVNP